jgi:hypothetical protein
MMDISIFRRAAEQFNREKARLALHAPRAPAPAPAPKKATTPPAPAQTKPAPRTPTAEERLAERLADRKRREREHEKLMAFVKNPQDSPFAHLAPYRAPEVELPQVVELFAAGRGSDAAEFETHVTDPQAMAREVIKAAELARNGGHALPAPTGFAAKVIAAGEKRRSLSIAEPELPTDPTARAIVLAGRRRRGEIA